MSGVSNAKADHFGFISSLFLLARDYDEMAPLTWPDDEDDNNNLFYHLIFSPRLVWPRNNNNNIIDGHTNNLNIIEPNEQIASYFGLFNKMRA